MASAAAPRRVDGASTAQPGRRAAAARRRRGPPSTRQSGAPRTGAQLHLDKTVPRRSVSALEAVRMKAPARFRTRAATSSAGLQRRSKAAARRQCQRYQTRAKTGHGAGIRACSCPLFKKEPPRPLAQRVCAAAQQDCQEQCRLTRGRRGRVARPPLHLSFSPPFTQCYRRGPFWPASGATARAPFQVGAPPAMAPWQPHHNAGDPP